MGDDPWPESAPQMYLVERYWPGMPTEGAAAATGAVGRACAAESADGRATRLVSSMVMPMDETLFLWIEAVTEAAVARVCERAGVSYDRATVVLMVAGVGE